MNLVFPICIEEKREIDGFDFISVLGLMKEYNWKEIWRRYLPVGGRDDSISMYTAADSYFLELHIQKMQRIILSEKFNTSPFFMQQVIQRITASHDHDLIMSKIYHQGIDAGINPISLSCSMGNIIIDLIANRNEPFSEQKPAKYGNTRVEILEKRPIDVYDFSSTLYLCQQNLTESIFRRYQKPQSSGTYETADWPVNLSAKIGDYQVSLRFRNVSTNTERVIPAPGNASVSTMHQVLQRMNFRHSPELILKEMTNVGLALTLDEIKTQFTLRRYINNTELQLDFKHI